MSARTTTRATRPPASRGKRGVGRGSVPPQVWFVVSAVFHYLGPSFAVLLFPVAGVLGVAWMRIASAALIFAAWRNPYTTLRSSTREARWLLVGLGVCLAAMNTAFYLALERLPMSLVAAIEFAATVALAALGLRTLRNFIALLLAAGGVCLLIDASWHADAAGLFWALANALLFAGYVMLGHRIAARGALGGARQLGAAMAVAAICLSPIALKQAFHAFDSIELVLAGVAVGLCSSVIPYVCDQLAMARIPRASFALMLSLLPATATAIGYLVLAQVPGVRDLAGVLLVMLGVALHRPANRDA